MSYDVTTTPAVGDATKRSDYVRLRDAIAAVRQMGWPVGGSLLAFEETVAANTYTDLPDSGSMLINGTDLSGLSVYLEATGWANAAVSVTITLRLYNVTDSAAVSGSECTITNPSTTKTVAVSSSFSLASGAKYYKVQIKRSVDTVGVAARARVYAV